MFESRTDPLGIGVMGRARENRLRASLLGQSSPLGPLPDPQWEGWLQSLREKTGGRTPRFGYETQPEDDLSRDPEWAVQVERAMPRALGGLSKSRQLGTPIDSLRRATRGAR